MATTQRTPSKMVNSNSFKTLSTLRVKGRSYSYHSVKKFKKLPFSLRILLENLLRHEDGVSVTKKDIQALLDWSPKTASTSEIQFTPARVLLQDFTGVPAVADLASMRGALKKLGGSPSQINPLQPADLVIDHSVQVDFFGTTASLKQNSDLEFTRNKERYQFLRWGQSAFKNFRVVPPDTGIVHQVNLEFLAHGVMTGKKGGKPYAYFDTLVGTDSHSTMINGLGVLGWGVGGIEAEAALLGQPCTMLIPEVVGFKIKGKMPTGTTATDLVLIVTQMLRKKGVVGKFVEFFGPGLKELTLADRATIANMAPEYGATCGLFPVDAMTTQYLRLTGRVEQATLVEAYFKAQGLWAQSEGSEYSDLLELDLTQVEPSLAGPSRPQDRVPLSKVPDSFKSAIKTDKSQDSILVKNHDGVQFNLGHGSVVIAAITSCTNTSNPSVLIAAGLLARNAVKRGLQTKPWVKTSLAPGSKVVTDYLTQAGLLPYLEALRFQVVGYGCTTCIGNAGPLPEIVSTAVTEGNLAVVSVLSGNRNFEGRINNQVRANYLASPPLVVAYALAGDIHGDLNEHPLGYDPQGKPVFLKDIWPSSQEVGDTVARVVTARQFSDSYKDVFKGDVNWQGLQIPKGELYQWDSSSTYIKEPPFFDGLTREPAPLQDIKGAYALAMLGDSVTTDHISPAGSFSKSTPAGIYLTKLGVKPEDFNSYGARRGNHEVMVRGTFANVRLKNFLVPGIEGGFTRHIPTNSQMTIFEASEKYQAAKTPLIVIAGKEYGTGSSRDWAAKGPKLLGIRAVIAESFERIHRSNLVGMGILPLQFLPGEHAKGLGLTGEEVFEILNLGELAPGKEIEVRATPKVGGAKTFKVKTRIDTPNELEYFRHGGILLYVLRQQLKAKSGKK